MAESFGVFPGAALGSSIHITRQTVDASEIEIKGYQDSKFVLVSLIMKPRSFNSDVFLSSIALQQNDSYTDVKFAAGGYGVLSYYAAFQSGVIRISMNDTMSVDRLIATVFGFKSFKE